MTLSLFLMMLAARPAVSGSLEQISHDDPAVVRLTVAKTAIVDGVSFRDAIWRIADRAGVNVWIDRRVDPTEPVQLGPIGPNAFLAIAAVAESRDCVVGLVGNVVLVGRAGWVDRTTAAVMTTKVTGQRPVEIVWPRLSTPTEALAIAGGDLSAGGNLPHDLWPATEWKSIDRNVAQTLVRSQFELPNVDVEKLDQVFIRSYRAIQAASVRRAVDRAVDVGGDPKPTLRVIDGALEIRGTASVHRLAATAMLASVPRQPAAASAESTFSLKATTSAQNALHQLCRAASMRCTIKPSAAEACQSIVTIQATDLTLRELIEQVARQAGVQTEWTADTVVISRTP